MAPSEISLSMDMRSFRGLVSSFVTGWPQMWIAVMKTAFTCGVMFGSSRVMVFVLSIYTRQPYYNNQLVVRQLLVKLDKTGCCQLRTSILVDYVVKESKLVLDPSWDRS